MREGRFREPVHVGSDREIEIAFTTLVGRGADGLLVGSGEFTIDARNQVCCRRIVVDCEYNRDRGDRLSRSGKRIDEIPML